MCCLVPFSHCVSCASRWITPCIPSSNGSPSPSTKKLPRARMMPSQARAAQPSCLTSSLFFSLQRGKGTASTLSLLSLLPKKSSPPRLSSSTYALHTGLRPSPLPRLTQFSSFLGQSAAKSFTKPVIKGWLTNLKDAKGKWEKRYCVIESDHLFYYKTVNVHHTNEEMKAR